jgi:hypothetical protein
VTLHQPSQGIDDKAALSSGSNGISLRFVLVLDGWTDGRCACRVVLDRPPAGQPEKWTDMDGCRSGFTYTHLHTCGHHAERAVSNRDGDMVICTPL